jgi:hypothetical protein
MGCTRSQVNDNKKNDMKIQRNLIIKSTDDSYLDIIQNNNFKININLESHLLHSNSSTSMKFPKLNKNKIKNNNSNSRTISQISDITNLSFDNSLNKLLSFNEINPKINFENNTNSEILNVKIIPNKFEMMYPIWIEKDTNIYFNIFKKNVNNNNIKIEENKIDEINNLNNLNEGILIGRILNGNQFIIYDNLIYKSDFSGPLFIKMNIKNKIMLNDYINLKIKGAKYIESFFNLEEMIGWKNTINNINYINSDGLELSKNEKDIVILINKIRVNSKLFSIQYLENIKNMNETIKNVYNIFVENKVKLHKFIVDVSLKNHLENYFKLLLKKENKIKNKQILNCSSELNKYIEKNGNKKNCKTIIKIHNKEHPLSLVIRFIIDDNIRKEILNEDNNEFSLFTMKTRKKDKNDYFSFLIFNENYIEKKKVIKIYKMSKLNKIQNTRGQLEVIKEEPVYKLQNSEILGFDNKRNFLNLNYSENSKNNNEKI